METSAFLEYVQRYEIPPTGPSNVDWSDYTSRGKCTKLGMWAIVTLDWTRELANWIGERKVLEVMAGKGWLAKALSQHGTNITATDNKGWTNMHADPTYLFPVEKLDAFKAVTQHSDADVLLISWPPYGENAIVKVCQAWGTTRPIIYIGESEGGCNAPDKFFRHFRPDNEVHIAIPRWPGLHDYLQIGYWSKR